MQKKIIALAIAAAFSAPAFADNANVTVYGKVDLNVESVKTDNANGTSKNVDPFVVDPASALPNGMTRVASNASRFGVKGSEDLGNGLQATYQYEVQVDANGNAGNGFGNSTRNTGVGLKGDSFGTLVFGNWDTPYKMVHNKVELFDNTHFASATNLIGRSAGVTAVTVPTAQPGIASKVGGQSFNTRLKNSIQYTTPNFGGFDVKIAYGTDATTSTNAVTPTATANYAAATGPVGANLTTIAQDKSTLSIAATYEQDLFYVAAASETAYDAAAQGTAKGNNSAARLVGALKFGHAGFVGLTVESMSITDAGAAANSVELHKRTGYELAGSYLLGEHRLGASYAKMGDFDSYADTGASQIALRYGYNFTKRTELYAMYAKLTNKTYGQYNLSAGNVVTSAAGATLSGFGAGVSHSF